MNRQLEPLLRAASRPYLRSGIYPWQFARWKLRLDPVFFSLLEKGCLPDRGCLLDVGCGQGVLLTLLVAAREQYRRGEWPSNWAPPPLNLELQGLESRRDRVSVACRALRDNARITRCDVREVAFPRCSAITVLDLLLYLEPDDQQTLLEKAAAALEPDGLLLLRDADAAAGVSYQVTRWSARLSAMGTGGLWSKIHCRSAAEWTSVLEAIGFSVVVAEPKSEGTPFNNMLFMARKRA